MNIRKILKRSGQFFKEFMFLEDNSFEKREAMMRERKSAEKKFNLDFKRRVQEIKENNSFNLIMNHYVPIVAEEALKDGLLIGEHQTVYTATQKMLLDKRNGKVDELYNLIEDKEDVKK